MIRSLRGHKSPGYMHGKWVERLSKETTIIKVLVMVSRWELKKYQAFQNGSETCRRPCRLNNELDNFGADLPAPALNVIIRELLGYLCRFYKRPARASVTWTLASTRATTRAILNEPATFLFAFSSFFCDHIVFDSHKRDVAICVKSIGLGSTIIHELIWSAR